MSLQCEVQRVCAPRHRFQAVLMARGTESLFRIVETNDFKQLPHITLAFRPGNDSTVKQVCCSLHWSQFPPWC